MNRSVFLWGPLLLALVPPTAGAVDHSPTLRTLNARLAGQVVDHTHNHGCDCRIWSCALNERRDLYVYLPPGFDPQQRYPLLLLLHGLGQDEQSFLKDGFEYIDRAIVNGTLPPLIVAVPDGTAAGRPGLVPLHSAFLNTQLGNYEDYLLQDVWDFLMHNYPIRPEREAHVIGGVSIGGGSAYHHAIKHRDRFGVVFGIFPALNTRWVDCHGRYFGNFDPCCWGWRTSVRGGEVLGRYYGVITIPLRRLVFPLYGRGPDVVAQISRDNPIEMLDRYDVQEGELAMYVAWGGRDQFNLDAHVESFVYRARQRGLTITTACDPRGKHDAPTARRFVPGILCWLGQQLAPLHQPCYQPPPVILEPSRP